MGNFNIVNMSLLQFINLKPRLSPKKCIYGNQLILKFLWNIKYVKIAKRENDKRKLVLLGKTGKHTN